MPDVISMVIINSLTSCNSWHTAAVFKWQCGWAVALCQWIKFTDHRMATEDHKTVMFYTQDKNS